MKTPQRRRVVVVSPLMPPASGGAAVYYESLTAALASKGVGARVDVLTEAVPGRPRHTVDQGGQRHIWRVLPHFSHRGRRDARTYVAVAMRQLFVSMAPVLSPRGVEAMLIHGGFHIHPSFLGVSVQLAKRLRPDIKMVADVRDQLVPPRRLAALRHYDEIIACGENVRRHLADVGLESSMIPVPVGHARCDRDDVVKVLGRYALTQGGYLLFTNGVNRTKNIDLAVAVRDELVRRGMRIPLVVVGRNREMTSPVERGVARGAVSVLGALPHDDVLALMKGSGIVLNLSPSEGVPRSTLEAIDVGARVLLPAGVPEFAGCGPVADLSSVDRLAEQVMDVLKGGSEVQYDLAPHRIDSLTPRYVRLLLGTKLFSPSSSI